MLPTSPHVLFKLIEEFYISHPYIFHVLKSHFQQIFNTVKSIRTKRPLSIRKTSDTWDNTNTNTSPPRVKHRGLNDGSQLSIKSKNEQPQISLDVPEFTKHCWYVTWHFCHYKKRVHTKFFSLFFFFFFVMNAVTMQIILG